MGSRDGTLNNGSVGPVLSLPILDGGSGAAQLRLAQARLDETLAGVWQTLRAVVQEVELALRQLDTAQQGGAPCHRHPGIGPAPVFASDAGQCGGRLSLFELEDARSTLTNARGSLVAAQRHRARDWVVLVKATGNGLLAEVPAPVAVAPAVAAAAVTAAPR